MPTGGKPNQRFACFYVFHGVKGVGWGWLITFICTASHTWCYATLRLLALPHIHDATLLYVFLHCLTYMMLRYFTPSCPSSHTWCYAQLTMFGGWSKDPCLRIFIRRMLGIQPCSMARFGRMFALGSGDGKTVPTTSKPSPNSLQRLWRTLSVEKKRRPLRFLTCPVKSTRALLKEIQLWERCKTTVIYGMKWMMNSANVGNAGSINHPPVSLLLLVVACCCLLLFVVVCCCLKRYLISRGWDYC